MDELLCEELLQEIFRRLPPVAATNVSLVSRRWCRLIRSSTTSLKLHVPYPYTPAVCAFVSAFLRKHCVLSTLAVVGGGGCGADSVLLAVGDSCPQLRSLIFSGCTVSISPLFTLASLCAHLSSIDIHVSRPLCFHWLPLFKSLKQLSISLINPPATADSPSPFNSAAVEGEIKNLEILSLNRTISGDYEVGFLWRNCKNIKKLKLTSCESLGDHSSFLGFLLSCGGLQELELRSCRTIVDVVLLSLAGHSVSVNSLSIHDGCSRESLLQFINQSRHGLKNLNLRLPLDLENSHLIALSEHRSTTLTTLRLESSCLPIGDGLKALTAANSNFLEELALVNCKAVEREPGLLTTLGQNLRRLRKLDLSYNENIQDKELSSMLASCTFLTDLKLSGCSKLTDSCLHAVVRNCKNLETMGMKLCCGISSAGVEYLVENLQRLKTVEVEAEKVPATVKTRLLDVLLE